MEKRYVDRRGVVLTVLSTGLMILIAIFAMLPFAFMFLSSLKPARRCSETA